MVKLLFLPHCLLEEYVNKIRAEGEKKGYEVYIIRGSSIFKKTLENYDLNSIEEIVGVVCEGEIEHLREYTKKLFDLGIEVKSIPLLKDGCKDTSVDLEKVLGLL